MTRLIPYDLQIYCCLGNYIYLEEFNSSLDRRVNNCVLVFNVLHSDTF